MSIIRQYASETLEEQSNPNRKVIRYFVPSAPTSNSAIASIKSTVVNFGATDPDGATNGLLATSFRATERVGAGSQQGFYVDVEFTRNGGGFSGPQIPNQEPDYRLVDFTTERRKLIAPVFKQVPIAVSDGTTVTQSFDWARDDREFEETFQIVRVRCNVSSAPGNALATIVTPQLNKVHQIYGADEVGRYRFIGVQANQVNGDVWRITYEWERDNGSVEPTNADADNEDWVSEPILLPPARPPYHDYEANLIPVVGPVLGPNFEPSIKVTRIYEENLTGANSFPGNPKAAL